MVAKIEARISIILKGCNAVDLLAKETSLSKQKIKHAMNKGCVWVTRGKNTSRIRRAKRLLSVGETLHLYYDETVLQREPCPPELIADEGDYSVWNKPYGMLSQGSKWGDHCTITRWAEQNLQPQRPAFVVHRLDRAARGLIVVAHSKNAAAKLSQMFANRQMEKIYLARVDGSWPHSARYTINQPVDDKPSVSHVNLIDSDPEKNQSLLQIQIESGRKHQIRQHLSQAGFPIVGDRLYGNSVGKNQPDLKLMAVSLNFTCPITGIQKSFRLDPDI